MWKMVSFAIGTFGIISMAGAEVSVLNNDTDRCELFRQLNGSDVPSECNEVRTRSIVVKKEPPAKPQVNPPTGAEAAGRIALRLQFAFNSTKIHSSDQPKLVLLAELMKNPASAGIVYRVEGNTDKVGSAAQNDRISQQRAEAVRAYLIDQGVKGEQLVAQGNGFRNLADPASPRGGKNRRVEVINTRLQ